MHLIHKDDNLQILKTSLDSNLSDLASELAEDKPFVLLDSCGPISEINQWSFLACRPKDVISFKNGQLMRREERGESREKKRKDPFEILRNVFKQERSKELERLNFSPYIGGPIGYFSYDVARYIEKIPEIAEDDLNLPDFYFIIPTLVYAHNLKTKELFIYQYFTGDSSASPLNDLPICHPEEARRADVRISDLKPNMTPEQFQAAVKKIKEHIFAGDVYQVNLSQRFESDFKGDSFALYKHLRTINPGPFCGFLKAENFNIISSSPERLVCLHNNNLAQTRPIAGTRRRGQDQNEDDLLSGNLLLDEKERAEHIMLVDLERNDLGKVCDYSTIKVDELMSLEKYSHVIHIVSNVQGFLHKNRDQFDLVKAMFPGGTITGCPKVKCMEIIEQLEPTRRGPYTGSLGYFSYNGNIDFNILIRTIAQAADKVYLQAGAGVVADSIPEREYFEAISKAQALFRSIGHSLEEKQWEKMSI